jgi:hypothetical protein
MIALSYGTMTYPYYIYISANDRVIMLLWLLYYYDIWTVNNSDGHILVPTTNDKVFGTFHGQSGQTLCCCSHFP